MGFHRKQVILCLEKTGFLTLTIFFVRRLQLFSTAGYFSLWTLCPSGSRFCWWLTCLREYVPGAGVVCRLSCSALRLRCPSFYGVMICDRFFLFLSHVGSHSSGGLLPLLLSPWVFVSGGFSQV